ARLRLIFVHRATVAGCLIARGSRGRNDLLRGRNLGDNRLELRVEQGADVEAALVEELNDLFRNSIGVRECKLANLAKVHPVNDQGGKIAPKYVVDLLAHADDLDRLAFALELADMLPRRASDLRIEPAAQSTFGSADDEQVHVVAPRACHQRRGIPAVSH